MATIKCTRKLPGGADSLVSLQWANISDADTGEAIQITDWADKSIQVEGTIAGATFVLEGSNDGTNYRTLTDSSGTPISLIAVGVIKTITENPLWIRPRTTGGAGATITATIIGRTVNARKFS